jgi:CheY-like chemotaxis protein
MATTQQTKTVLIVDDEPNVVTYLEMLLSDHGYATVSAADGDDAMKKAREQKPDLITLDISMPETSGLRFYRELKADPELANVPVVIVTAVTGYAGDPYAYLDFMTKKQHNLPHPDGFFPKPIDKDEFIEAVGKLLS